MELANIIYIISTIFVVVTFVLSISLIREKGRSDRLYTQNQAYREALKKRREF
tara:strand:+ start:340 stop:498 length:159 start_codon:yes stop_codon:yes gene_type:complete